MSRSRFTNVAVFAILILEFCGNGCTNLHQVSGIEACLDKVWDLINSALLQIVDTSLPSVAATRPNTALAPCGRARPAGHPAARIAA